MSGLWVSLHFITSAVWPPHTLTVQGRIFLDRCGQLFSEVLSLLRDGLEWKPPEDRCVSAVQRVMSDRGVRCRPVEGGAGGGGGPGQFGWRAGGGGGSGQGFRGGGGRTTMVYGWWW